ncbi:MAG: Gfo/Idh/MocA family oxidoreductase [Planctomycetes bacterium]|nr:Gfo/Idh/MocA family oxidoreductase [Planctomycetota bacterium]
MVRIAMAGVGEWGKNLLRNFASHPDVQVGCVCDPSDKNRAAAARLHPAVRLEPAYEAALADPAIDAVVIAAPAVVHFEMARAALLAGKHVYVEKPMCLTGAHARALAALVPKCGKVFMVGHLLEYHPAVAKLRGLVESGEIGRILYIYSQRLNLGRIRHDENALWSFAPHDVSVITYLLGEDPVSVCARGADYIQEGVEDVVFINLEFRNKRMANVHLSWLDPNKVRKFTIVGTKKMAVFDDMEGTEKIRIYDKGAEPPAGFSPFGAYVAVRSGDILIPQIDLAEPLRNEVNHFVDCVKTGRTPRSDVMDGLRVVRIIEAAQRSLKGGGGPVPLDAEPADDAGATPGSAPATGN